MTAVTHLDMPYHKFTIENFRSYGAEQALRFGQPVDGQIGSGLTYIVGANNSGKTTLIEGVWQRSGQYLNDSERRPEGPPLFKFYSDENTVVREVKLRRAEASEFIEEPNRPRNDLNGLFEIISSRRHWTSNAGGRGVPTAIMDDSMKGENPRKQQSVATALYLKAIEGDDEKYQGFTKLVQRIIPEFTGWSIGYESEHYVRYHTGNGMPHKSDFLGDGVISVIRILAHLFENRNVGLIIDEPELSLHPAAQKKLVEILAECAQRRQIIISTHSPYFLRWEYIRNGAMLNRVSKVGDVDSTIYPLDNPAKYSGLFNGANWQQPFVMDEVAKEIFFAEDNVLFLEGQEDVGLLRHEFQNSKVHIFGYGVRGCGNFRMALTMAQDLGFTKVAALLDKGDVEDALMATLTAAFPDYQILQWDRNDIRDKVAHTSQVKTGYFDANGNKKEDLGDFEEKITAMRDYFAPNEDGAEAQ